MAWNNHRGAVSLTFDDGLRNQIEVALPLMKSYDIQGTFFLIQHPPAPYSPDFDELAWKKAVAVGNEIGSHSVSHRKASSLNPDQAYIEARDSKIHFEKVFGRTVTSFCYPYTDCPAHLVTAVKKAGYSAARAGRGAREEKLISAGDKVNPLTLPAVHVGESLFADGTIWTYIDEAISRNAWVTFMLHAVGASPEELGTPLGWDNVTAASFEKLMQVLSDRKKKNGLWVAPFGEVARHLRK